MWLQCLLGLALVCRLSSGQVLSQQECSVDQQTLRVGGNADVVIGALFPMRDASKDRFGCGEPTTDMMQAYEAAKYALNYLNSQGGLTFGMDVFDTCHSPSQALRGIEELYPQSVSSNPYCSSDNSAVTAGFLGLFDNEAALHVAELAATMSVSIISPRGEDPALSDKFKYPTFLRTSPSSTTLAKAIVALLSKLEWENLLVIYVDDAYGSSAYQELLKAAHSVELCVSRAVKMEEGSTTEDYRIVLENLSDASFTAAVFLGTNSDAQKMLQSSAPAASPPKFQWIFSDLDSTQSINRIGNGAISLEVRSAESSEFAQYFSSLQASPTSVLENPWFMDWFETVNDCSLTSVNNRCPSRSETSFRNEFVQSPWVVPTMEAIFAFAETVKSICPGQTSVCNQLTQMSPEDFNARLRSQTFTLPSALANSGTVGFDSHGDPLRNDYSVINHIFGGQNNEIGRYAAEALTLDTLPTLYDSSRTSVLNTVPTARCSDEGCNTCVLPTSSVIFRHTAGDLVIASLVTAHKAGNQALTCGESVLGRLSAIVAAEWAVSQFKVDNPNKLNGVSLGSLVADICPDRNVAMSFLTDLLSGNNRLEDDKGRLVTASKIKAFVDHTGFHEAKEIQNVLSQFRLPEIQTGTTSSSLKGGPYFSRAIPTDEDFFEAIASLLQRLNWNYVQVAARFGNRHNQDYEQFREVAAKFGVCVSGKVDLSAGATSALEQVGWNHGSVVVVLSNADDLIDFLNARQAQNALHIQVISGSDGLTADPELFQGLSGAANDLIVVQPQISADTGFQAWLASRTEEQIKDNVFLRDFFEVINECSLVPESRGQYSRTCNLPVDNFDFYQGQTPYVIESVNLVASKLHEIIADVCGGNYDGLCSDFHASSSIEEWLQGNISSSGLAGASGFGIKGGEALSGLLISSFNNADQFDVIGTFDGDDQLTVTNLGAVPNINSHTDSCPGQCIACQYLYTQQSKHFMPGDYLIVGTFSVSESGPSALHPYICGDVRESNGPQYTTAMMYALEQVNKGNKVSANGVSFGGLAMDHCNNDGRVELQTTDVFSGLYANEGVDATHILSWITDNTHSTHAAAELLEPLGIAMVSPSATSSTLMEYDNFYRTIQGDTTAVTAVVKIINSLQFSYIQVVYSDTDFGHESLETTRQVASSEGICITNVIKMQNGNKNDVVNSLVASKAKVVVFLLNTADTQDLMQAISQHATARTTLLILMLAPYSSVISQYGHLMTFPVLSLSLEVQDVTGYRDYLARSPVENPFFAEYYMKMFGCNLPGSSQYSTACSTPLRSVTEAPGYSQDNYALATINAVYASVDAFDRVVREFCGNEYTEPCEEFKKAENWRERYNVLLNSANFIDDGDNNFRFLEREGNIRYNILQAVVDNGRASYQEVGSYAGVSLSLSVDTDYNLVKSECLAPCLDCLDQGISFSHTLGDIYLAGLFDVHVRSFSPFTCGGINTLHGYLLLEAFHFALNQVNEKKGAFSNILRGTRLGGVGLDQCGSRVLAGNLISNINSGKTSLARDGVVVSPGNIDTYVGPQDSVSSLYVARILTDLEIPQISYAATSTELKDERLYPFFFRTVPSDESIVTAMLAFLDKDNIRYVQVVYEDSINAYSSMELFREMAEERSICVAQQVVYPRTGEANDDLSNQVVSELIKIPAANTVVTFLDTPFIKSVLGAVGRSDRARGQLRFFGDLSWADNQEAIRNVEIQAVDSLTMKLDSNDVQAFESYMSTKTLANSRESPWFEEYYQHIHQCFTNKAHTGGYNRECSLNPQSIINSVNYQQDPGVVYVMNAVYASAYAIHQTLVDTCGENYVAVCEAYKTSSSRRVDVRNNLDNVTFTDPVGNPFMFDDREAKANFRYYSITPGRFGGANYDEIGSYSYSTGDVTLVEDYSSTRSSDCDRQDACRECPTIRNKDMRYFIYESIPDGQSSIPTDATTVVAFFDIHEQGADPYRCGKLNMEGFHHFLAFLYSATAIVSTRIDGVQLDRGLRLIAVDTCSNSLRVDQDLFGLLQGSGLCNAKFDLDGRILNLGNLGSVLTVGDPNTFAASRVLEGPAVTYVSPYAPNPALDDKMHLVRTSAPLSAKMKALTQLLGGCHTVDVIYEDSVDGVPAWQQLSYYADMHGMHWGSVKSMSGDTNDADFDVAINSLSPHSQGQVVIVIGNDNFIKRVFASARDLARADDYLWILVSDWEMSDSDVANLAGSYDIEVMTLSPIMSTSANFDQYVHDLKYEPSSEKGNNALMPREWFEEFYQTTHGCTLAGAAKPINVDMPECDVNLQVPVNMVHQDSHVVSTIAAMYAVTDGLNEYIRQCRGDCNTGQPLDDPVKRESIKSNILAAQWALNASLALRGDQDLRLRFDQENRWWNTSFEVVSWEAESGFLGHRKVYTGMLMEPETLAQCALRQVENASTSEVVGGKTQEAEDPRNYYDYKSDGDRRFDWPIWAMVVSILTGVGILMTFIMFLILLCAYPYRGGTSALGYLAIIGIMLIFGINFAFFVHASDAACGIRRFLMGVVYMVVFASLLVKAVDNWRFLHTDHAESRYSGVSSPCSMVLYALCLVLVECIVPAMWLILRHPEATDMHPDRTNDHYWCEPNDDYDLGLVLSMSFVAFVISITAIFSALAYDSGRNNFESRWILFGCVASAGCFLVWMVVSTNAKAPYRDPSVAIANLVNAAVLMIILPLRKTILLFRAKRDSKGEKYAVDDDQNGDPYSNPYDNSYNNPAFQLSDYESSPYMEG